MIFIVSLYSRNNFYRYNFEKKNIYKLILFGSSPNTQFHVKPAFGSQRALTPCKLIRVKNIML